MPHFLQNNLFQCSMQIKIVIKLISREWSWWSGQNCLLWHLHQLLWAVRLAWSVIIIKVQLNSQMLIRLGDLMEILLPWSFSSAIAVLGVGSRNLSPSLKISSCQEPHPPLPFYQNGFAMAIIMGGAWLNRRPRVLYFLVASRQNHPWGVYTSKIMHGSSSVLYLHFISALLALGYTSLLSYSHK